MRPAFQRHDLEQRVERPAQIGEVVVAIVAIAAVQGAAVELHPDDGEDVVDQQQQQRRRTHARQGAEQAGDHQSHRRDRCDQPQHPQHPQRAQHLERVRCGQQGDDHHGKVEPVPRVAEEPLAVGGQLEPDFPDEKAQRGDIEDHQPTTAQAVAGLADGLRGQQPQHDGVDHDHHDHQCAEPARFDQPDQGTGRERLCLRACRGGLFAAGLCDVGGVVGAGGGVRAGEGGFHGSSGSSFTEVSGVIRQGQKTARA